MKTRELASACRAQRGRASDRPSVAARGRARCRRAAEAGPVSLRRSFTSAQIAPEGEFGDDGESATRWGAWVPLTHEMRAVPNPQALRRHALLEDGDEAVEVAAGPVDGGRQVGSRPRGSDHAGRLRERGSRRSHSGRGRRPRRRESRFRRTAIALSISTFGASWLSGKHGDAHSLKCEGWPKAGRRLWLGDRARTA